MGASLDQLIYDATRGLADAPEGTRLIPLTQGLFAIVDDASFDLVSPFKWCAHAKHRNFYAARGVKVAPSGRRYTGMHRVIVGAADGVMVDHRDSNGLNNCLANLRVATHAENMRNRRKNINGRLSYKGIHLVGRRYQAWIMTNGKRIHLGLFTTEIEAAIAYDAAAKRLHGDFARLNFPDHQHLLSDTKNVGGISSCL